MKIVDAKVIVCCPGRNFVTLKLTTEDGITGLGDATLNGRELAVSAYLTEHVVPLLIGRDANRINDTWQYLYRGAYWRRGPVTMTAIGAVDIALWDIQGKALGRPVYQLLGGAARDGVMIYGHASGATIDETVADAARFLELHGAGALDQEHEGRGRAVHDRQLGAADLDQGVVDLAAVERRHQVLDGRDRHAGVVADRGAQAAVDDAAPVGADLGLAAAAREVAAAEDDAVIGRRRVQHHAHPHAAMDADPGAADGVLERSLGNDGNGHDVIRTPDAHVFCCGAFAGRVADLRCERPGSIPNSLCLAMC